jgi:membrane-associated phospholipid phosphatase
MLNHPSRSNPASWTASALLLTPLLVLCVRYLDVPLAYFVKNHLFINMHWSQLTSDLPDLLLQVVLLTTFVALSLYLVRTKKGIYDATTQLAKLVTWAAPTSYLVKSVLKFVFGRVNTRFWLQQPDLYGFHWFQRRQGCEGFPSGHMVVIVTLLAALWRFYPKSRPCCLLLGLSLGVALIATDYHFLSDVIAGAYVGVFLESALFWLLLREPRHC